jgi:hypothetical protein
VKEDVSSAPPAPIAPPAIVRAAPDWGPRDLPDFRQWLESCHALASQVHARLLTAERYAAECPWALTEAHRVAREAADRLEETLLSALERAQMLDVPSTPQVQTAPTAPTDVEQLARVLGITAAAGPHWDALGTPTAKQPDCYLCGEDEIGSTFDTAWCCACGWHGSLTDLLGQTGRIPR